MRTERMHRVIDYSITAVCAAALSLPIVLLVSSAFKVERDIFSSSPEFLFAPTLENFQRVLLDPSFLETSRTTVFVTIGAVFFTIFLALPAAYAYSRSRSHALRRTAIALIAIRMFPPIVVSIPLYPIVLAIGIFDTPWVLIPLHAAFELSVTILLLKIFIDSIPPELEEAAMIDGCTRSQAFVRITFPLIAPGVVAASIFVALSSWNDYLFALLFASYEGRTLPIYIAELMFMVEQGQTGWGTVFAAATLQMVPVTVFILLVQKRLLSGFTVGAVKG